MAPTGGTSGNAGPAAGGNVKVVVRVRPFNTREKDRNAMCVVEMKDAQTILRPPSDADHGKNRASKAVYEGLLRPPSDADHGKNRASKAVYEGPKAFKFDKSYWSFNKDDSHFAGQSNLFDDLGTPLLDNAFTGYNNCIFAYGQTGSGKSYSMMGYGDDAGIIPRICRNMFERIDKLQTDPHLKCTVEVSYLEIYNERVRDLLNPATKGNLRVREHPSTGPYVEDLAKLAVQSFSEIEDLMDEGNKARTVAATNMNETSSRSHAVFTLTLTQKRHDLETRMDTEKVAKISLVDLAGSERATSTGATGARLKEGAEINRSLSTLGRVIATLADLSSGKKGLKVPYRDSVLTWLLKDSLGGNSMTAMIATISPADINFEETLSTLRYADSAKRIKNHAVVNEDPNARMIRELKEELAQLRSKLAGGAAGAGPAEEIYPEGTPLDQQFVSIIQADGSFKRVSKAQIQEQLTQSEKLYKDLNQTWEEKLLKTEEIHREREAALEELGISIAKGNVGLSSPKKMPHLVNLSDDPLLAECLVYNLKPGITTVGNADASENSGIRLNGSKILEHHCQLENVDSIVTIIPAEGAAVMVNGVRVVKSKRLKSGNRIILGDFHIFRFNNPLEAKAERPERSLLRHSVTASQLSGSPSPFRPTHDRTHSIAGSEPDGASSQSASPRLTGRDSDWLLARREAASALLGADSKINQMTDEQLDQMLENLQRERDERRGNRDLFDPEEDSTDDLSSFLVRDKYMSNGTIDNLSLDTILTVPGTPSTPGKADGDATLKAFDPDTQQSLNETQRSSRVASPKPEAAKEREDRVIQMKQEMERQKQEYEQELQRQKQAFEEQMKQLEISRQTWHPPTGPSGYTDLSAAERATARIVVDKWQQRNNILIAEAVLQNAGLLKEAQVMSKLLDQDTIFQFAILDLGQESSSSYDLIMHDISGDDDEDLADARKPCLAVRVVDVKHSCIHLWSLAKLNARLAKMRQMYHYKDQPEYRQHFRLDNPFRDSDQPLFTFIGDGTIPLTAVFETRVQDFNVEITSPYTRQVIGRVRISLEPSLAEPPPGKIKFNIVMRDLIGFSENEGSSVHAQMSVLGTADESVATTQTISGFREGPVKFESIHNLSVAQDGERSAILKIAIFAQVTTTHLDKLTSWDELREMMENPQEARQSTHRLPETEYQNEDRHDVFAKVQLLELAESGQYLPVEVVHAEDIDDGVHQLHQGLQRRISITLTQSLSDTLPWDDLNNLRVGEVHLIDSMGHVADISSITPDIPLKQIQEPMIQDNADGTSYVTIVGQWDSSLHKSLLLDRTTSETCRIRISLRWDIISSTLDQPMTFSLHQHLQIQPRSYLRPQSVLKSFWSKQIVTRSSNGLFNIVVRPISAKRAADLWRLDTSKDYINGEELLGSWEPRGISLVKDYINARRKRRQLQEIESAKASLGIRKLSMTSQSKSRGASPAGLGAREEQLLRKYLAIWKKPGFEVSNPIFEDDLARSANTDGGSALGRKQELPARKIRHVATVTSIPKNAHSLKSGHLLMPAETPDRRNQSMQWKRRFVDLRPPYLLIYSAPDGEGVNAVNLTHARIDREPNFRRLLGVPEVSNASPARGHKRTGSSDLHDLGHVFAVYGERNTFLFAARNELQKQDWILKIDQSFVADELIDTDI